MPDCDWQQQREIDAARLLSRYLPNAGPHCWEGTWPLLPADARPDDETPVVYALWDGPDAVPAYIGSSYRFAQRLRCHATQPMQQVGSRRLQVVRWRATRFASIEQAPRRESDLIAGVSTRFNRRRDGRADYPTSATTFDALPAELAFTASLVTAQDER